MFCGPALECLVVCEYFHGLEANHSSPFSECRHYGVRLLLSCHPIFLTFPQFAGEECHGAPLALDFLPELCSNGVVTGVTM